MTRRVVAGLVVVGIMLATTGPPADASPVSDKQAEAKRIARERERLTQQAEQANEHAKQADDELATLTQQLATSTNALATQVSAVSALQQQLAAFAVSSYTGGDSTSGIVGLVTGDGANETALRRGYAPIVLGANTDILDQLRAARQDVTRATTALDARLARQRQLTRAIASDRADITRTEERLARLAASTDRELAAAIATEQAKQAAAAEAAAAARLRAEQAKQAALEARRRTELARQAAARAPATSAPRAGGTGRATSGTPAGNPVAARAEPPPAVDLPVPPTSPAAAIAVAEALRQLGKPYVFGTNGPDTFDCSGLTQWAWARAGVGMPHYTVSQFNAFPRVGTDALQPGDLVFFNVDLGHMGMYIGNGNIVQAPRTGDVVKISSLRGRDFVGAVRPG